MISSVALLVKHTSFNWYQSTVFDTEGLLERYDLDVVVKLDLT